MIHLFVSLNTIIGENSMSLDPREDIGELLSREELISVDMIELFMKFDKDIHDLKLKVLELEENLNKEK